MNYNVEKIGKKILHFEDDRFIGGVFKVKFESEGFDFKPLAQTPEKSDDLIKLVLEEKPDLIIMGVILPVRDGYTATKILKSNKLTKNIPIFGLDDLGLAEDINQAIESGMTDYLVNAHYTPSEIVDIIKNFLAAPKKYQPRYK